MKLVDWFSEHYATLQQATTAEEAFANPLARLTVAGILAGLLLMASLASSAAEEKKRKVAATQGRRSKPTEMRGYTRAQVAQHTAEDDLWLIIRNRGSDRLKVYDVTSYVEQHPGGDAIFAHAGGDCTEGFTGIQHPPTVFDLVEEYCIGWLEDP